MADLLKELRPKKFSEVLGNKEAVKSLKEKFNSDQKPHCVMFSGLSGGGKTTLMRICSGIVGAMDLDIHEFNIGDARGIEDARGIIQLMNYQPYGGSTVIILDEIHNSTKLFQESLLKPFEDIPEHVYVFIATTEPSKIIPTLKRRFTHYQIKPVESQELFMYLAKVAKQYSMKLNEDAMDNIIEQASGSTAIALSLLNTIMEVGVDEQLALLDYAKNETNGVIKLCQSLLYQKGWNSTISIVNELEDSPEGYRRIILNYMMKVLLNPKSSKMHHTAASIIDIFVGYIDTKAEFVMRCYKCTI